jgi:hypothetical protein
MESRRKFLTTTIGVAVPAGILALMPGAQARARRESRSGKDRFHPGALDGHAPKNRRNRKTGQGNQVPGEGVNWLQPFRRECALARANQTG